MLSPLSVASTLTLGEGVQWKDGRATINVVSYALLLCTLTMTVQINLAGFRPWSRRRTDVLSVLY